ncbi:hypothetical protein AY599_26485 [Leptolyngbya valderiana BDU 20041]|nr:hypothetical protein AY599_26485 [Leptolyngbya valderiana BDU 20041]
MLSDTIRHIDLSVWPEAALVLFVGVFVMVTLRTLRAGKAYERAMAAAALDEGVAVATCTEGEDLVHV